jgi:hypothetical protein
MFMVGIAEAYYWLSWLSGMGRAKNKLLVMLSLFILTWNFNLQVTATATVNWMY